MPRRKGKAPPVPLRIAPDVLGHVESLVARSGWSESEALSFLARCGASALGKGEKLESFRTLLSAAAEHHQAELQAKKKLLATGTKLRDAKRALQVPGR